MIVNQNRGTPKGFLTILIGPWIFYLIIFFLFDVKFISFNKIVIVPILFAVILSVLFFLVGYKHSYNNVTFKTYLFKKNVKTYLEEPPYIKLLIFLALFGCIFSLYFDVIRTLNNDIFFNLRTQGDPLLYSLRISKSMESAITGSNLQLISKTLFPISFFFYISNFAKKYIFYKWLIIILSLTDCLVTGGRFYFLYFFIIFILSYSYYNKIKLSEYFRLKYIILLIICFLLLLWSFSLRMPPNLDLLSYYKYSMGIETIALENKDFGIFNNLKDSFLAFIIYIVHSLHFLSIHYEQFAFDAFAYGGYTFNLIFRILNNLFNTNLLPISRFYDRRFNKRQICNFCKNIYFRFWFFWYANNLFSM
tara:strand:- start:422 stop:1510 length:1089 start_codon:yes stop_codon:yes gene_type:complete